MASSLDVDPPVLSLRAPKPGLGRGMEDRVATRRGAAHVSQLGNVALHLLDPEGFELRIQSPA